MSSELGTPTHPLYFLHLARTAGSSITRLIDDAFPVAARCPHTFVDEFRRASAEELSQWGVFCGHLGLLPLVRLDKPVTVVTVLREPAARAWSHFRMLRWTLPATAERWERRGLTFDDLLRDPGYGTITRDFQSRWLARTPIRDLRGPEWPGLALADPFGPTALKCEPHDLAPTANRTLGLCAVVGLTDQMDATVDALARVVGRPLSSITVANRSEAPGDRALRPDQLDEVRRRSPTDVTLVQEARRRLDEVDRALPPLPSSSSWPMATLPCTVTMDDAFTGAGWHARHHTTDAGWHRWSGPDVVSSVWLPLRARGRVTVALEVIATAEPTTLDGARLAVQGKEVAAAITRDEHGIAITGSCEMDDSRPLALELTLRRTARLRHANGAPSGEPAGIALRAITVAPFAG